MERVLVVDDLTEGRELMAANLARAGFEVCRAEDGASAWQIFEAQPTDLVVTDHRMPGLDGLALLRRIRESSQVPVLVMTAFGSVPVCEEAMRLGAQRFLEFARDLSDLGQIARETIDARRPQVLIRDRAEGEKLTTGEARALGQRELRVRLERLVIECRGNIAEMARRMDRDRSTVRYHLRRNGLL